MVTEIWIEGFQLDVSADISSLLNLAIDDIKDFASRQTAYSKTIVLPGTAKNNAIFGNIFDTGISNDFDPLLDNIGYNFNASKSARCYVFQDNLQAFKGTLRMLMIVQDGNRIEYEVALNGELTSLNVALSSGLLEQLDFSAYDQAWTVANISASWNNTPGSGVYFPHIDYGNVSVDKHNWVYKTFRPAFYVKEYIDKIFAKANFRYTSDLFNTDRFKRLIVPHNTKQLVGLGTIALRAQKFSTQVVIGASGPSSSVGLWDGFTGGAFTYAAGGFTYTDPTPLPAVTISWRLGGYRYSDNAGSFTVSIKKNGTAIATTSIPTFFFTVLWSWASSIVVSLNSGDVITVEFNKVSGTNQVVSFVDNPATLNIDAPTTVLLPLNLDQQITMNDCIPKNIRQIDFLTSIVKLFNLYVYESQFDERTILIKPYIDFYSTDPTNAIDWTYKLNRNKVRKVKPLSELNSKLYNFNYKADNDYYNALYAKRYNQGYGSYIYDTKFEFASQSNTLELIFAATPLVGYNGEEKVYSTIFKRTGDITPIEETTDSVIRILQSKKVAAVSNWNITTEGGTVKGTYNAYGYAGHLDDPDFPSTDLNFGALQELFFVLVGGDLTRTQFNVYWSPYMAEITDKDSKLLTGNFYLTPKDIFTLDFSKYIVVDGVLFRLNKIIDYNLSQPDDCAVELLKVMNTNYSFPPVIIPVPGESNVLLWDTAQAMKYDSTDKILNS